MHLAACRLKEEVAVNDLFGNKCIFIAFLLTHNQVFSQCVRPPQPGQWRRQWSVSWSKDYFHWRANGKRIKRFFGGINAGLK